MLEFQLFKYDIDQHSINGYVFNKMKYNEALSLGKRFFIS